MGIFNLSHRLKTSLGIVVHEGFNGWQNSELFHFLFASIYVEQMSTKYTYLHKIHESTINQKTITSNARYRYRLFHYVCLDISRVWFHFFFTYTAYLQVCEEKKTENEPYECIQILLWIINKINYSVNLASQMCE